MASAVEQFASNLNFGAFAKAEELKQRLWFTLGALLIYRVGTYVPLPGINPHALEAIFQQKSGGILDMFNMFSGGSLQRMAIFALGLALVYFPFGFYFIGKPSQNYTYTIPVLLGFIYALGISTLLISAVNIDSYRYPLIAGFFVLLALVIYLVVKLRSAYYPAIFVNAQFIRIGFIILTNLIVLLK